MLTGQRAFEGEDVSMTLSRVLQQEPDWSRLPSAVSPSVSVFLQRCFKKDPKQRVHDVADVRLALEGAFDTGAGRSHFVPDSRRRGWQRPLPLAMAGLALVLIGGIGSHLVRPVVSSTSAGVTRFPIVLPADDLFDATRRLALSPDGAYLVYWANFQLYLRPLAQMEATPIGGTDRARDPFFSADGQWVGFWRFGQLKKVALAGGAPVTIGTVTVPSSGASWGTDDTILVGLSAAGVGLVWGTGGIPETLIEVAEGEQASAPQMLPGGEWVLFTLRPRGTSSWNDASIVAQSLETSERRVLIAGGRDGRYVHTGHLVYALEGTLFAAPFNTQTISVMPGTLPVVEGIADDAGVSSQAPFSLSNDGTLVYVPRAGAGETGSVLGWVDREGQMTPLTQARAQYQNPRISPDGSQVVVTIGSDAWLYDIERDASTRLTEEGSNSYPAWTPDGQRVTFSTDRSGTFDLYEKAVDGRGSAEPLLQTPTLLFPGSWSPDGTMFAFYEVGESGVERDIRILERGGETRTFLATEFNERIPRPSPDGRWLAYVSDQSGEDRVYVQAFPDGGAVIPISTGAGTEPVWSRDGAELFFRDGDRMMVTAIKTRTPFATDRPEVLFEAAYDPDPAGAGNPNYDVAPDGRFLMVRRTAGVSAQINVVLHWLDELQRLVPID